MGCGRRMTAAFPSKADIKPETPEIESENVRFTLGSGRSTDRIVRGKKRPEADISNQ